MQYVDFGLHTLCTDYYGTYSDTKPRLETVNKDLFGQRLSTMLNTYIQTSTLWPIVQEQMAGTWDGFLEVNQTVMPDAERSADVYDVSRLWASFAIASYLVLLGAGFGSVVFAHLAKGPEILGFATTVVRENDELGGLPEESRTMHGMALASKMKRRRVRYGLVRNGEEEKFKAGVGDQRDTTRIEEVIRG